MEFSDDDDEQDTYPSRNENSNLIQSMKRLDLRTGCGVLNKQKDALSQYRNRNNIDPMSIPPAPTPSNTIIKQQNQGTKNAKHTPNSLTTNHAYHPHISTIFPSVQSNSLLTTNPVIDAPMNFFDAETSSAGIQKLTQTLPDKHGYILPDTEKNSTPLLVFVNSRSGPQQGHVLLNQFRRLLNPIQIYDLANGKPEDVLQSFSVLKNLRILVCGGDGTVAWIVSSLEKLNLDQRWPPIAILPLGTGNDLARIHGWGGGYSNESLLGILKQVQEAYVSLLDRWELTVIDHKGKEKKKKCFMNYLGIGVDAQVAHEFHMLRESEPRLFFSRFVNKAWFGIFGAEYLINPICKDFTQTVTLMADGVEVPLPPNTQGIIILNIDSYAGGTPLWNNGVRGRRQRTYSNANIEPSYDNSSARAFGDGDGLTVPSRRRKSFSDCFESVDENDHCIDNSNGISATPFHDFDGAHLEEKLREVTACDLPSSCQDGLMDIVTVQSSVHLGQIRVGLSNAHVVCQCKEAEVRINRSMAIQVDGEPWRQNGSSVLKVKRKKEAAIMLHRAPDDGSGVETEMSKLLGWAEERQIIDKHVHDALMKEFSRRIECKTRQKRVESQDNLMISLKRAIVDGT